MTNEEYREYVHTMYKENFLDKGKKPKWIQIFGDSFGHFIDEGTWPYEFSKIIGCPVVTFAQSGANNQRTMSYFHQYYDEDCLNIVLFTGSDRLYIKDDLFSIVNLQHENVTTTLWGQYQKLSLSENHIKNLVDGVHTYFKYLEFAHFQNFLYIVTFVNSIKNHFSYGTQKYFAKFLSDMILFNIVEIDLNKLEVPKPEEELGPKEWADGLQARLDAFAQCDIILLPHHRKASLFAN